MIKDLSSHTVSTIRMEVRHSYHELGERSQIGGELDDTERLAQLCLALAEVSAAMAQPRDYGDELTPEPDPDRITVAVTRLAALAAGWTHTRLTHAQLAEQLHEMAKRVKPADISHLLPKPRPRVTDFD